MLIPLAIKTVKTNNIPTVLELASVLACTCPRRCAIPYNSCLYCIMARDSDVSAWIDILSDVRAYRRRDDETS